MRRCTGWLLALAVAGVLAGCPSRPTMEPAPVGVPVRPEPAPTLPLEPPTLPPPTIPEPRGLYFLHEQSYGAEACEPVGEVEVQTVSGPAGYAPQVQMEPQALNRLAARARDLGGNVVVLPHFDQQFDSGMLAGQAYRCGPAERRSIFDRARAARGLTIVADAPEPVAPGAPAGGGAR